MQTIPVKKYIYIVRRSKEYMKLSSRRLDPFQSNWFPFSSVIHPGSNCDIFYVIDPVFNQSFTSSCCAVQSHFMVLLSGRAVLCVVLVW